MNHTGPAARVGVTPTPAGNNVDRAAAAEQQRPSSTEHPFATGR